MKLFTVWIQIYTTLILTLKLCESTLIFLPTVKFLRKVGDDRENENDDPQSNDDDSEYEEHVQHDNSIQIKINQEALIEACCLRSVAINTKCSLWFETSQLKICHLNIRSLRKHIKDSRSDPTIRQSNFICLSETWMPDNNVDNITLTGHNMVLNSYG